MNSTHGFAIKSNLEFPLDDKRHSSAPVPCNKPPINPKLKALFERAKEIEKRHNSYEDFRNIDMDFFGMKSSPSMANICDYWNYAPSYELLPIHTVKIDSNNECQSTPHHLDR